MLKWNGLLDDESDEEEDSVDDYENILENLRDGGDLMLGGMGGKKIFKGGIVFGLVMKWFEFMFGDLVVRVLFISFLRDVSWFYMVMLNEWLYYGGINDLYFEFFIKEFKSIRWECFE